MIKLIVRDLAAAAGIGNALVLSRQSGLAYAMCYKLWNDQQTRIDLTTIDRLCDVLRCSPGDLFVRETPTARSSTSAGRPTRKAAPAEATTTDSSGSVTSNKCRRIRWID
jgi:putative transcriptional regulator